MHGTWCDSAEAMDAECTLDECSHGFSGCLRVSVPQSSCRGLGLQLHPADRPTAFVVRPAPEAILGPAVRDRAIAPGHSVPSFDVGPQQGEVHQPVVHPIFGEDQDHVLAARHELVVGSFEHSTHSFNRLGSVAQYAHHRLLAFDGRGNACVARNSSVVVAMKVFLTDRGFTNEATDRHCQVSELCIIEVTAPGDFHQVGPWDLFDDSKERRQWGVGDVEDPRAFHVQVEPLIAHLDLEITGPSIGRRQFVGDVAAGAQQTSGDPGLGQRAVEWFGGIDGALQPGSNGLSRSATAAGETTPCGQFRPNVLLESSVAWLS